MGSDRLWFDPRMMNVACVFQWTDVALVGGAIVQVLPQSSRRWGVGFAGGAAAPAGLHVAPWPDLGTAVWDAALFTGGNLLTLFNAGPMVSNGWWATSIGAVNLRVMELLRN